MYLKCLLICQLLAVLLVRDSLALSCVPCAVLRCAMHSDCPGGTVLDECGCCHKCAKLRGEQCGGLNNQLGVCAEGLLCVRLRKNDPKSVGVCQGSCISCALVRCAMPTDCPGGTVLDGCGCCHMCAKVEGEECGGLNNHLGVCDQGLVCVRRRKNDPNSVGVCQEKYIKLKHLDD